MKLSLAEANPELSFGNLEKQNTSPETRPTQTPDQLLARERMLETRLSGMIDTSGRRAEDLSFGKTPETETTESLTPVEYSLGNETSETPQGADVTAEGLSMGEEVSSHPQKDEDLGGEKSEAEEKALSEKELQAIDAEHQALLKNMKKLGIEGIDEEDIANAYGDLTEEERVAFEQMNPEEQAAFMQEKYAETLARNEEIIAQEQARLQAEIDAGVSPQRRAEIGQQQSSLSEMSSNIHGEGSGNTNFNRGGNVGSLTPEQMREYGATGEKFVNWIKDNDYPDNGVPANCGRNTGDAINGFYRSVGKPELQINDRPRHGYMWSQMLANRPDQYKQVNCTPEEAPAGALISYAAGPGGSSAFAQYGHIEVALGQGNGFYFGAVATGPGGSKQPPQAGEYVVYMPIGLGNAGETPQGNPGALTS